MFLWFETQKFSTQLCTGNGTQLNCWEIWLSSDKNRTLGPHMTRSMLLAHQFVTNLTNSATVRMTQWFEGTLWHRDTGHIPWESNVLSFLLLSCVQWYTVWCRNNLVKFLENSPTQQIPWARFKVSVANTNFDFMFCLIYCSAVCNITHLPRVPHIRIYASVNWVSIGSFYSEWATGWRRMKQKCKYKLSDPKLLLCTVRSFGISILGSNILQRHPQLLGSVIDVVRMGLCWCFCECCYGVLQGSILPYSTGDKDLLK